MLHFHIIGDSHIGCLADAYRAAAKAIPKPDYGATFHPLGGGAVAYDMMVRDHQDRWMLNPLFKAAIVAANRHADRTKDGGSVQLAMCIGGYVSTVYAWDRKRGEFDLLLESGSGAAAEPRSDVMLLPSALVRDSLHAHLKVMFDALEMAKQRTTLPLTLLSPPPPYRSSDQIVERMAAKRSVRQDQVPQPLPAEVRLKIWQVADRLMREQVARLGIPFVDVPATAVDAEGYLLPELYGDGFHASAAYGALLLDALLQSSTTAPSSKFFA